MNCSIILCKSEAQSCFLQVHFWNGWSLNQWFSNYLTSSSTFNILYIDSFNLLCKVISSLDIFQTDLILKCCMLLQSSVKLVFDHNASSQKWSLAAYGKDSWHTENELMTNFWVLTNQLRTTGLNDHNKRTAKTWKCYELYN